MCLELFDRNLEIIICRGCREKCTKQIAIYLENFEYNYKQYILPDNAQRYIITNLADFCQFISFLFVSRNEPVAGFNLSTICHL